MTVAGAAMYICNMVKYIPDESLLRHFIESGLHEDVGTGDVTSLACIDPNQISRGRLLIKDTGIIAGIDLAAHIFHTVDPDVQFERHLQDGDRIRPGDVAFFVTCSTHALLKAERLSLNAMQRMSGIATLTGRFLERVSDLPVRILDTRKTTPGIRFLEKWAVNIAGGDNYRHGLYDWFMIKDNHIKACGDVRAAIQHVHEWQQQHGTALPVTVEVRNQSELEAVLETGMVTRIMLDNFELQALEKAVKTIDGRFESEASGGVNLNTIRSIAETGVDYISVGALTHSATALDMSLKIMD